MKDCATNIKVWSGSGLNGIMVGGKCTMILCSIAKKIQNLKIQIIPERLKAK